MSAFMSPRLRIAGISQESIVDGRGIRYVIFVQGCPHKCEGCHNPQTHDFNGGQLEDTDAIINQIKKNPILQGVTFSGGEPFCQPLPLIYLAEEIKKLGMHITVYSGYTFEELIKLSAQSPDVLALLKRCDVLIDGRFDLSQKDLTLPFRGSSNQRILNVQKSLEAMRAIEEE